MTGRPMRKIQRQITDREGMLQVLEQSDVCRVAFIDGQYPYIVPMNFGFSLAENLTLYFHCATEGRKLDIMQQNNCVAFEMDCMHQLKTDDAPCDYSMNYASITGTGQLEMLSDETERRQALDLIMKHYGRTEKLEYRQEILDITVVLKLNAIEYTGKRLNK